MEARHDGPASCTRQKKAACLPMPGCEWYNGYCRRAKSPDPAPVHDQSQPKKVACSKIRKAQCVVAPHCEWKEHRCKNGLVLRVKKKTQPSRPRSPPAVVVQPPPNRQSTTSPGRKRARKRLTEAVREVVRPFVANDGTYAARLRRARVVQKYVQSLSDCITFLDGRFTLGDRGGGGAGLDLTRQIGSKSKYGAVFLSQGRGIQKMIRVALKVTTDVEDHRNELDTLELVSGLAARGVVPNFPFSYGHRACSVDACPDRVTRQVRCPTEFLRTRHLVVLSELADGDLKQWIKSARTIGVAKRPVAQYASAMCQIFLGLVAFQSNLQLVHNDMHWGNALYHTVPAQGWWHYRIREEDVYVQNCGQLWVLWDFGMVAEPEEMSKRTTRRAHNRLLYQDLTDFARIVHAFVTEPKGGWAPRRAVPSIVETAAIAFRDEWDTATHGELTSVFLRLAQMVGGRRSGVICGKGSRPPSDVINRERPYVVA